MRGRTTVAAGRCGPRDHILACAERARMADYADGRNGKIHVGDTVEPSFNEYGVIGRVSKVIDSANVLVEWKNKPQAENWRAFLLNVFPPKPPA